MGQGPGPGLGSGQGQGSGSGQAFDRVVVREREASETLQLLRCHEQVRISISMAIDDS